MNANKVVSLGTTPPQIGVDELDRRRAIRSAASGRSRSPGWNDKNGDGILTVDEVHDQVGHDVRRQHRSDHGHQARVIGVGTFRGYAEPRYLTSFTPGIDLFNHKIRIQNLFDWRGGNKYYNNTERIRCTRPNCNGLFNPAASLQEQAMVVAAIYAPEKTLDGYMQPGAFVKWREASATLELPQALVSRVARAQRRAWCSRRATSSTWTNYRGSDPESDFTATRRRRRAERVPDVRAADDFPVPPQLQLLTLRPPLI